MGSGPKDLLQQVQQLQQDLQQAQRRLQAVADVAGTLMGKLEFSLQANGVLLFSGADAMADRLIGKPCAPHVGKPYRALFPGLHKSDVVAALCKVAREGGVLQPQSMLGEGTFSGKAFDFFAFQLAPGRVVVKFWDSSGAAESHRLDMRLQQQLVALFTTSPLAISLSVEHDGRYVDVNEEWSRLTGLSLQEVLGRTAVDIGFWDDTAHRDAVLAPLRETGRLRNQDVAFVRADGAQMILQLNASRIEIGGAAYILCYLRDVTWERMVQSESLASEQLLKATNNRLSQQVELFESIESLAAVGHWTSSPDGTALAWSNGLYRITGLEAGTVLDSTAARSRIHADDRKAFDRALSRLDGETAEYRWHHPDGRIHWLRARMRRWTGDGDEVVHFGVVQDVTYEFEAARALQDKLRFVQKITSRVPGMVFQLRRRADGGYQYQYVSDLSREIFRGVTPDDLLRDASCTDTLYHPDDLRPFYLSIEDAARKLTAWHHEYRLRFDDGEVRWLQGQAIPEREADGAVLWNGLVTDITARKQAEESLRASEARFRALTALSSDWYWEQDELFRFVRLEGGLVPKAGARGAARFGRTRWELGALNMGPADWDAHRKALEAHQTFYDLELQDTDDQGRKYWMSISGEPFFDAQGVFKGYRGIGRNISGRKSAEEKIERLAFYDALTGLPNRRLLLDRLQHALAFNDRDKRSGALLFIDLDNFKDLNDTKGHDMGDQLLKQVAIRLAECVRDADTVARLGGDEFVVMLEKLSPQVSEAAGHAEAVGRKILATLNQAYRLGGQEHHSTPSIGIALFHDQMIDVDELLKRADLAMYEAKSAGRNTLRFFDPAMQAVVAERAAMELDLRQALQRQELQLHYQPIVNEHGTVVAMEALVRWASSTRGLVMPNDFIALAEKTALILPLGRWVLESVCAQLVAWAAQPRTERLSLAINVSARQFRQADFGTDLLALLRQTGANPYRLKLEITESMLLGDIQDVVHKLGELRAIGVSFSLDDFGTGYSSLAYLKQLPLEQLKLDQSFVRDVMTDPNDAAIAQAVLTLGQSLGLAVVAEGVETQAQRDFLARHGCRLFQGFLYGRPVPLEQLKLV